MLQEHVVNRDTTDYVSMFDAVIFDWLVGKGKQVFGQILIGCRGYRAFAESVFYGLVFVFHEITPNVQLEGYAFCVAFGRTTSLSSKTLEEYRGAGRLRQSASAPDLLLQIAIILATVPAFYIKVLASPSPLCAENESPGLGENFGVDPVDPSEAEAGTKHKDVTTSYIYPI
jgi:hypothetical protein